MDMKNIKASIDTFVDDKVVNLQQSHKIAICAAVVILPVVAFYFLSFSPSSENIDVLDRGIAKLTKELNIAKSKAAKLDEHKAMMKDMELKFKEASIVIPDNKEIPSLLKNISGEGTGAGLDILSFVPGAVKAKEFYAEISVTLTVNGTYHNLGHFLDTVSKMPRIVNVSNVKLGAPKSVAGEMLLNSTVNLVTYKFIEPSEAKKSGKKKRGKRK